MVGRIEKKGLRRSSVLCDLLGLGFPLLSPNVLAEPPTAGASFDFSEILGAGADPAKSEATAGSVTVPERHSNSDPTAGRRLVSSALFCPDRPPKLVEMSGYAPEASGVPCYETTGRSAPK